MSRSSLLIVVVAFAASVAAAQTPTTKSTSVRRVLDEAASQIDPHLREQLAAKPSPYLIKAHDVGVPTDFNTDIPWHLLDKEKDPRFDLPHRGRLGLFNTNSDVNFLIGFAIGDSPVDFRPQRRITDHFVNLATQEIELAGATANLLWLPVSSDTLLVAVMVQNIGSRELPLRVVSVCSKRPLDEKPFDRYDYGITCTTGKGESVMTVETQHAVVCRYQEWAHRSHDRVVGSLLCTMALKPSIGPFTGAPLLAPILGGPPALETQDAASSYQGILRPGQNETLLFALNLHRFGPEQFETNSIVLYPKQNEMQAMTYSIGAAKAALRVDWPALVKESYRWYVRMPTLDLPVEHWARDTYCAMELPRGNTWSAQDLLKQPWYTFCRVHGHNPYGWWSYGMHAHEHLATFVTNLAEPTLSQSYLRGQFQVQRPDGFIPYGVNHKLKSERDPEPLATAPLLAYESWNAYLWSADRIFLKEAYSSTSQFIRWWRSEARTRRKQPDGAAKQKAHQRSDPPESPLCKGGLSEREPGGTPELLPLQHWQDYIETVRDDRDLATWEATEKAERQEALDLNCYLLSEERSLAAMARELGEVQEATQWDKLAEQRSRTMQEQLWHAEDGVFYGRDLASGKWARVLDISTFLPLWCGLATPQQARSIVRLLHDPQAFGTAFPVATLAAKEMPAKKRGFYHWRGANWVEMTWLVILGLKRYGHYDEAARLAEINCRMVYDTLETTSHFREFYSSLTGEPSDLTDYIWTSMPAAMVIDIFFGLRPTAQGLELMPALPQGWNEIALRNLHVRDHRVSLNVRRIQDGPTELKLNGENVHGLGDRGATFPWKQLPKDAQILVTQSRSSLRDAATQAAD